MEPVVATQRVSFECQDVPGALCPNCRGTGMRRFYRVLGVPVHSCLLMPTPEAALSYPTGDIDLAVCHGCGFIANLAFDPSVHEYSPRYEETQAFSPTFNTFADALARDLVERHDLKGKTVLEIGCGKGEFLEAMCAHGIGKGIGIDPGYIPQRRTSEHARRMEVIRDFYSQKYAHIQPQMICCRHTLEHIGPTLDLLKTIRASIGDRRDVVVFFEVPDAVRVMREGAFWDIYYEHCSYFSPASLAAVFEAAGFAVTELTRAYQDQYLLLTAVPVDESEPRARSRGAPEREHAPVTGFGGTAPRVAAHWRAVIDEYARRGRRVVLWGSGSKGVALLTTLGITDQIEYVVDVNPYRHDRFMPATGQRIVPPRFLREVRPDLVIAMNPIYRDEIEAELDRLGLDARCVAV